MRIRHRPILVNDDPSSLAVNIIGKRWALVGPRWLLSFAAMPTIICPRSVVEPRRSWGGREGRKGDGGRGRERLLRGGGEGLLLGSHPGVKWLVLEGWACLSESPQCNIPRISGFVWADACSPSFLPQTLLPVNYLLHVYRFVCPPVPLSFCLRMSVRSPACVFLSVRNRVCFCMSDCVRVRVCMCLPVSCPVVGEPKWRHLVARPGLSWLQTLILFFVQCLPLLCSM